MVNPQKPEMVFEDFLLYERGCKEWPKVKSNVK